MAIVKASIIFVLLLVQFAFQMLLGEDIQLTTDGEIKAYLGFSMAILVGLVYYTLARADVRCLKGVWAGALVMSVAWVGSVVDFFSYSRPDFLVLARITGLLTTLLILGAAGKGLSLKKCIER